MRTFLVLICSLALACVALGEEQGKKKEEKTKKKGAQAGQVSEPTGKAAGKPTGAGKPEKVGKATGAGKPAEVGKATGAGKAVAAGTKVKPQHFNLANKPKPEVAPAVKFQQNRRIEGSQNWQGSNYTVFRNYRSEWRDRNWWGSHYNRVVFVLGGWYYWNAGWWYPAWGYDPGAYYPYDGPIYGYNGLTPDQVVVNAQVQLQRDGYYAGPIDGVLGPMTRHALAAFQVDHGLAVTAAIDEATVSTLGLS